MMFALAGGVVSYTSDRPGNYATMFGPDGQKLAFRGDASHFDDKARQYTWAFTYDGEARDGDVFVFATRDREVLGEVIEGKISPTRKWRAFVTRSNGIEPQSRTLREIETTPVKRLITLKGADRSLPSASMRCMFVNPSVPYGQWACYKQGTMNEASFSAHGAAYVSATLKAEGHHCFMVDLRSMQNWKHVEDVLRDQVFDVAFVGFLSIDVFNAAAVVRLLKELHPDKPVVVGGLHVSIAKEGVFPREDLVDFYCFGNHGLLPDVFQQFLGYKGESSYVVNRFPLADYVILDDGEIAARDLVAALSSGRTPLERTIEGGAVPMEVARHLDRDLFRLDVEAYSPILPFQPTPMVTVTWARGCPFHCTYCNLSSQLSNTNVRTKPTELVEEELDDLHRRFNGRLGSLMIHDDLTFHPKAIAGWCELIVSKYGSIPFWLQTRAPMVIKWYKKDRPFWELLCRAGLTWASIGYESGAQRVLDYMKKDSTVEENIECAKILDEYGINSFANLLWGVPTETNDEANATVALARKIRPGFLSGSIYTSYPGTAQDKECRAKDMIVEGEVYTRSHLPWQYRIKGIDYPHLYECLRQAGEVSNYLRMPKLLPEDRKRDLMASSRGLPVH